MAVKISSCRPHRKNTLRAFIDIELTTVGMTIRDATWHTKDGKSWAGMPSRKYEKDGETKYSPYIRFTDEVYPAFQRQVAEAMKPHLASLEQPQEQPSDDSRSASENTPF